MASTLRPPKAPNLLVGPVAYEQNYQNQLNNAQRLYYNQIDNTLTVLLENSGGRYLNFPHIFASDGTTQYATGDSIPTIVQWSTVVIAEGFSLNTSTDAAIATYAGAYRVEVRLQAENSDTNPHTVYIWMAIDGTPVANSCTKFTIPAYTGTDSYVVCSAFIEAEMQPDSAIQLYWETDKAATSGGGLGVYLEAYPAQTVPHVRPAIPSAYGSIQFVSELSQ